MLKRTLTGAVILLVTALFIFLKQFSALFFDAFVLIIAYASLFEVIGAYKKAGKKPHTITLGVVPAIVFTGFIIARRYHAGIPSKIAFGGIFAMMFVAVFMLILWLTFDILIAAENRKKQQVEEISNVDAFERTKISMQIFAYPLIPIMFFFALNNLPYDFAYIGIILTFAVAMMTDTFAYLFGRFFGKKKFIPEISPKKTIAGVVGGFVGGIIAAALVFVFAYFSPYFEVFKQAKLSVSILSFALIGVFGSYITHQ